MTYQSRDIGVQWQASRLSLCRDHFDLCFPNTDGQVKQRSTFNLNVFLTRLHSLYLYPVLFSLHQEINSDECTATATLQPK